MNMLVFAPLVLLVASVSPAYADMPPVKLPSEVRGWAWDGKVATYDANTIFDYIDGIGEVYRAYNMRCVWAMRYQKPDQPALTVDLFEMGSPEDAYGVFSFERDGEDVGIGQGSDYAVGMLRFWKDRYFIAITAEAETEGVREAVLELGKTIASAIPRSASAPSLLKALPDSDLTSKVPLFFRHPMMLNRHFFVADRNILNLNPQVEGVLATYQRNKARVRVAVIRYPTESDAAKAWDSFSRAYLREGRQRGVVQTENRKWTAGRQSRRTLVIVFDAPSRAEALEMLRRVRLEEEEVRK